MTKIDDKNLENITGAGGSQDVEPEFDTHSKEGSGGSKPPEGGSPDPEGQGSNAGGTQNLQQ